MRRGLVLGVTSVVLAVTGYAAADVAGYVPGILTYDGAVPPPPAPSGPVAPGEPSPQPTWAALPTPISADPEGTSPDGAAGSTAPMDSSRSPGPTPAGDAPAPPSSAALSKALAKLVVAPELGPSVGVSVRDAITGDELYAVSADTPRAPASTTKILSALAAVTALDVTARMETSVVQGDRPGEIVLVAGGDTMLGEGASSPNVVSGRAGLGDLADQVAASLKRRDTTATALRIDATYAAGPRYPTKWKAIDVRDGFTQGVAMLGRASQRPRIGTPSVAIAEDSVATAFAEQLKKRGVAVKVTPLKGHGVKAPAGAPVLGKVESATYAEVIDLALNDSDDALSENLTRQAMVTVGQSPAKLTAPPAFVKQQLDRLGITTTGMATLDTSGLAYGQLVSATTIAEALTFATAGRKPAFSAAVGRLPVAGFSGTLANRYGEATTKAARGIPRAKTGTLTGVSSLAGTTVNANGRILTFVILADKVPPKTGTLGARLAIDRIVATLTGCACVS